LFWLLVLQVSSLPLICAETNTDEATAEALKQYRLAKADGKESLAVRHMLEYSEMSNGKNAPKTIKIMHCCGNLLYRDGGYRKAVKVLLEARSRAKITFGPFGGPAYQLNMDIAYAHGRRQLNFSLTTKYFDRALEALRENDQHKSLKYVITLVNIAAEMMRDGGLAGEYSATLDADTFEVDTGFLDLEREYRNYYYAAENYLREATELADELGADDEYLSSKIAIAMAKLKVMETADLATVTHLQAAPVEAISEEVAERSDCQEAYIYPGVY
jgi:hypothetical protein